jgi:hypothetical protein
MRDLESDRPQREPSTRDGSGQRHLCCASCGMAPRPAKRLEKHGHESTALLWLSVSEIAAIIDSFDALEAMHGLTLDERVLRDDLIEWIGGEDAAQDL